MIILIVHHRDNKPFYKDLRRSLRGVKYPILVVENETQKSRYVANDGGYELGALRKAMTLTTDDIFLLQDSCMVKDKRVFDLAAAAPGGVYLCENFQCYMGKFSRKALDTVEIPLPKSKAESVAHEQTFPRLYQAADPLLQAIEPTLKDSFGRMEEKHGRKNLVLENDYLIKYKGYYGQY